MDNLVRNRTPISARIALERLEAEQAAATAKLDYVAMMADVDLPEEDEINGSD